MKYDHMKSPLWIWFVVALFYLFQYVLRVAPGIMVNDIRQAFQMTAEDFSLVGALTLYAYGLWQIPVGLLVDMYGARRIVLVSLVMCIVGTFWMAITDNIYHVWMSRILIGLGSAPAFMCAIKIILDHCDVEHKGLLMGATLTLGTFGALMAGKPMAMVVDAVGWRSTMIIIGGLGVLLVPMVYKYLPDNRSINDDLNENVEFVLKSLQNVLPRRQIWIYAFLAMGLYSPLSTLADLWGVDFLMHKFAMSRTNAAASCMLMYFGLCFSSLILPWYAQKYNCTDKIIKVTCWSLPLIFGWLIFGNFAHQPWVYMSTLIFLGICCGTEMLCFSAASYYAPTMYLGTALGVLNTLNMVGGGLFQQAIGFVLDFRWSGKLDSLGLRVYSYHEYQVALSFLLVVLVGCAILSWYLPKDKRQQVK